MDNQQQLRREFDDLVRSSSAIITDDQQEPALLEVAHTAGLRILRHKLLPERLPKVVLDAHLYLSVHDNRAWTVNSLHGPSMRVRFLKYI